MHTILPLLGIIGLYFAFPNALGQMPLLALAYPLALYAMGLEAQSASKALRYGWLTGLMGTSITMYWISIPVHNVGGLPYFLAIPCTMVIGAYIGLYGGLFAALIYLSKEKIHPLPRALFAGMVWCLLEYLRGYVLTGFPWLSLSTAFMPWPIITQGAALVGMYGLSGILVTIVAFAYEAVHAHQQRKLPSCPHEAVSPKVFMRRSLSASFCALLLSTGLMGFGAYALSLESAAEKDSLFHGAFIQGNIDQNQKWSPSYQDATVQHYLNLSLEAITAPPLQTENFIKPSLLIWPETAMPFFFQDNKIHGAAIMNFAREHNVSILLGTPGYIHNKAMPAGYDLYNRLYLVEPIHASKGMAYGEENLAKYGFANQMAYYDKEHLVPFGEYIPAWLNISLLEGLMQGVGTFSVGKQSQPVPWQNLALGMLICYESIFPELARERVASGATVLLNVSNDAWFGQSSAPEQHLQLSAMRAIEQGRYLVRGTNTGISAVVDPHGRVYDRGPLFRATSIDFSAQAQTAYTPFYYIAPYLPWIVLILALALLCASIGMSSKGTRRHIKV